MEYAIGLVVGLLVSGFAWWTGFDRDRAFYPTIIIVIALYYVLFAAMAGSTHALVAELLVTGVFALVAVLGFKFSSWLVVAGLAAHGLSDLGHHLLVSNPGVPAWWPGFCLMADVGLAGFLALQLVRAPGLRRESAPRSAGGPAD
jgi:hypothetical protein